MTKTVGIAGHMKMQINNKVDNEEDRPVKWICERPNVWRVVYAD